MDAQDFRSLQEAYLEVYQEIDEAREDEGLTPLQKIRKRNRDAGLVSKPGKRTRERRDLHKAGRGVKKSEDDNWSPGANKWRREAEVKKRYGIEYGETGRKEQNIKAIKSQPKVGGKKGLPENYDLYDIILSHLLDEGYAETVESAQAIMVNMSEEWRDEIVEEMLDEANKAEKMLGLTPRQREQARNLHQYTGKPIFYGTNPNRRKKPDRSDPILNKSHKDMTAKRQASHKAGRHLRGDTGESGNVVRSRYQANKDHKDGYPSIKRVDT